MPKKECQSPAQSGELVVKKQKKTKTKTGMKTRIAMHSNGPQKQVESLTLQGIMIIVRVRSSDHGHS